MAAFCSSFDSRTVCNLFAIGFYKPYAGLSKPPAAVWQLQASSGDSRDSKSAAISYSLRLLEWHKVVDLVSSFSGTQLGREAAKAQLSSTIELSYEESKMRLEETSAAMELIKYGSGMLNFSGIDDILVKSAIDQACKGFPVTGSEAIAIASLIEFTENLQATVEAAVKEDTGWHNRFMPLAEMVMNASVCHSLVKMVEQVINEDGSVKDSASNELRQGRELVRILERKLYQLMEKLARNDKHESLSLEVCNINGRWCIKSMSNQPVMVDGLLLSSGLGAGDLIEPIAALLLNDELQHARTLVAEAEEDVLSHLTDKITIELRSIQSLLDMITQLDAVTARAKYCIEYGATYPNFFLPGEIIKSTTDEGVSIGTSNKVSFSHLREWKLYMPKACHPLLLQQYRENSENAKKALANAVSDLQRKKMQGKGVLMEDIDSQIEHMKVRVSQLERSPPVPVDFAISAKTTVLVITGPNSGGKTISLKTVGLASLMSKAGLYVLASEPATVPWFDAVYADIGDEQSLTQSLSTFSGHLRQISAIRSNSTCHSLVLLDEVSSIVKTFVSTLLFIGYAKVGAGTNPLEGAALGMSLLESFAESGSYLTIATTHHGELKTLKYSNHSFENACVEFDEESLKPTYRVLWGIPGRSNGINIAEKLGLSHAILSKARKLHGKSSGEINEIIMDMENYKQDFERHLQEAQQYLILSRKLHQDLLMARERVAKHSVVQKKRKAKAISDIAAIAHSVLRTKLQQYRESALPQSTSQNMATRDSEPPKQDLEMMESANSSLEQTAGSAISKPSHEKLVKMPEVGDTVFVPSIGKEAVVLQVLASKGEMLVQASNFKLRLRLQEIDPGFRTP